MSELSKLICEKCKIQTSGKLIFHKRNCNDRCYVSAGCGYKEFDFTSCPETSVNILPDYKYKEEMGWQYPYKQIEEIKKIYDKNGYDFVEFRTKTIDFELPENFMKLFKLITTIENFDIRTGNFMIPYIPSYRQITILKTDDDEYSSENTDPIKAFLTCVFKCISNDKDTADYIRETEWE